VTAGELLAELRRAGVDVEADGDSLRTWPAGAVPVELRRWLLALRDELVRLVLISCPRCSTIDYLPLGGGWRRCWDCGRRWGLGEDPGDPPDLASIAGALCLPVQPRRRVRKCR
jgi:hypothetical protein